jgi:hypothetical protein
VVSSNYNDQPKSITNARTRRRSVVAAEREDVGRFIGRADEILTAFVELQRAIYEFAVDLIS